MTEASSGVASRVRSLDGLRGAAILLVVISEIAVKRFDYGSTVGIAIFFVLSGYLITSRLLASYSESQPLGLADFYARRALRVLPALVVFLLLLPAVIALASDSRLHTHFLSSVPYALVFATDFVQVLGAPIGFLLHTWTLSLELQFYVVWPLVLLGLLRLLKGDRRKLTWVVTALAVLALAWHIRGAVLYAPFRATFGADTAAFALMIGAALASAPRPASFVLPRWAVPATLATFAGYGLVKHQQLWSADLGQWIAVLAATWTVVLILGAAGEPAVLSHPILVWFGTISYALYLWAFPLSTLRPHDHALGGWARLGFVALAVVLATLSTYLVERPALRVRSVLAGGRRPVALVAVLASLVLLLPVAGALQRVVSPDTVPGIVKAYQAGAVSPVAGAGLASPSPSVAASQSPSASPSPVGVPPRVLGTPAPQVVTGQAAKKPGKLPPGFAAPSMTGAKVEGCTKAEDGTYDIQFQTVLHGGKGWQTVLPGYLGHDLEVYHWYIPAKSYDKVITLSSIGVDFNDSINDGYVQVAFPRGSFPLSPHTDGCPR